MPQSLYSTLQILTSTGRSHPRTIPAADRYLQSHPEDPIAMFESQDPIALLCLRCFISHQIVIHIRSWVSRNGRQYQLTEEDLLPILLDDDGRLEFDSYPIFSLSILKKFNPRKGNLTSLTIVMIKHSSKFKLKLLEHGCYRRTDWSLLNETKPKPLPNILTHLDSTEILQYQQLLTAYRTIYRDDRLKLKQKNTCPEPTAEQLTRIATELEQLSQIQWTSETIFKQLQSLAKHIRQFALNRKSGMQSEKSLDDPNFQLPIEADSPDDESDHPQTEFLTQYRAQFSSALTTAIATTIDDRTRTKPQKATQLLTALKAYACDKLSMGDIAPIIGVRGQDAVSRLLQLTALRSDIRRHLLLSLKSVVFQLVTPEDLVSSDHALETALDEQIEPLLLEDAKNDKTPKGLKKSNTRLSIALCEHVDRLLSTPSNSS